ncbi:ABC transporter permease [Actinobacteria bacterium YIM 96077]|uniref:ABC transporter permease n=1 Tax=Phytoactinopolyspora halophila TaxID=1981511 RepID=A0A329QFI2_9ACTN|nr:ABC transporter permease [Phytoactinopolyspora halophila]AYY13933.1 ABC transporter permease [Actinobacteria bacterium YIM 96077]RAW10062.1 ABC transporter permease [Phytoactinopolyspora halophila]
MRATKRVSSRRSSILLWIVAIGVVLFLIAPVTIVVPVSFNSTRFLEFPPPEWSLRWYREFLDSGGWTASLWRSLIVGFLAAAIATPVGTLAALGLVRGRFRGKQLIRSALMLPLTVPLIVLSIGLYAVYSDLRMIGSVWALALAHATLGLPFVVLVMSGAVQNFDETLERAAWTLGASKLRTFWQITIPSLRPALAASALFAFIMSFDEIVIAVFVSGVHGETLPVRIFSFLQTEISPVIAAVSTLLLLALLSLLLGRGMARVLSARRSAPRATADR